jgi:alkylglycerol monooxygenase
MSPSQIIVLASPVFLGLIALEFFVGRARGNNTYRLNDAVTSIGLGMLSQVSAVFTRFLRIGIYTAVFTALSVAPDTGFWFSPWGWLLALVVYDFFYYWNHRLGHTCAVFWAAHVVHHQSEDYNLSTALRQTSSGAWLGWVFYLPMALIGVPPLVFGVIALVDLLYQFWIHTQQIGRLGWFDRVFASPSNHRVHHAVNDRYVDKNYGGVFMLWDHLFGSFEDEDPREPCVYGTRSPLRSWDPLWANGEVYSALWRESRQAHHWRDKLRLWFMPPGWQSTDMAQRFPKAAFDLNGVHTYAPPMSRGVQVFSALQFVVLLAASSVFLWFTDGWPMWQSGVWFAAFLAGLWSVGAVMQGRITMLEALMIECAALAMATSAVGLIEWHWVFKPLTMVLALALVGAQWHAGATRTVGSKHAGFSQRVPWLLAALIASLAGDAFLMLEGFFIPGLVAFLLAHLAYMGLFRQDAPWLAAPRAWIAMGTLGLLMYGLLWSGGLPAALRMPVAAYVLAIVAMASLAMGRSAVLGNGAATLVAVGAGCFMLSDATLAINRFVTPIPHSPIWVLSSYYMAQCLIVMGWLRRNGDRQRAVGPTAADQPRPSPPNAHGA